MVVGIAVGNAILQAIDGATKGQGANVSASGMLFTAGASNANKVKTGTLEKRRKDLVELLEDGNLEPIELEVSTILKVSNHRSVIISAAKLADESVKKAKKLPTAKKLMKLLDLQATIEHLKVFNLI